MRSFRGDFARHVVSRHAPYLVAGGLFALLSLGLVLTSVKSWHGVPVVQWLQFVVIGVMVLLGFSISYSYIPVKRIVSQVTRTGGMLCPKCMYDLPQDVSLHEVGVCPECRRRFTPAALLQGWRDAACLPLENNLGLKRDAGKPESPPESVG